MSVPAYSFMPITFKSLVIELRLPVTRNVPCVIRNLGRRAPINGATNSLSLNEMEQAITSASQIDELQKRFHLAGGEAFMKLGDCIRLFDHARAAGFADLTTTTNAFWARSDSRAREIIKELRSVGLSAIELSWDVWHAPYVHVDAIIHCIKSSFDAGIRTNLRILTTKSHPAGEALANASRHRIGDGR